MLHRVQLCAQAMCLEEMLTVAVPEGVMFDSTSRRRQPVVFDSELRLEVEQLAARMHSLAAVRNAATRTVWGLPDIRLSRCAARMRYRL